VGGSEAHPEEVVKNRHIVNIFSNGGKNVGGILRGGRGLLSERYNGIRLHLRFRGKTIDEENR